MSRAPHILYAVYVIACLVALVWPIYAWAGARIEPRILGVPFAFAWNVFWVVASFVALLAYDRLVHGEDRS